MSESCWLFKIYEYFWESLHIKTINHLHYAIFPHVSDTF